jgi:hypothetical protein
MTRLMSAFAGIGALLVLLGATVLIFATSAHALPGDAQFLSDLQSPRMVHPPWSDAVLLENGHQVCFEVGKVGNTPVEAREWVIKEGDFLGTPLDYATAGTFVHFALHDLCPDVLRTAGDLP